jgi:hypothetical protein
MKTQTGRLMSPYRKMVDAHNAAYDRGDLPDQWAYWMDGKWWGHYATRAEAEAAAPIRDDGKKHKVGKRKRSPILFLAPRGGQ